MERPRPEFVAPLSYEEWGAPGSAAVGEGRAAPAAPVSLTPSDAVADALETIALRVRTGELVPLGYESGMGDAAAVATALTALLAADR